jgi:hypothetical protein
MNKQSKCGIEKNNRFTFPLPFKISGPAQSRTGNTGFGGPDYIHLTTEPLVLNTNHYEFTKLKFVRVGIPLKGMQK